jgi:Rrf2 family protein
LEAVLPRALNISEAAAMALHTMVALAGASEPLSSRELATRLMRSEAHMSKVLQRLLKAGFVKSNRGPRGGFMLTRSPADVIMLEIYEAMDGPLGDVACTQTPPVCDGTTCVFGQLVTLVNRQVREYLGAIRLSELTLLAPGRLVREGLPIKLSHECSCGGRSAGGTSAKSTGQAAVAEKKRRVTAITVPK